MKKPVVIIIVLVAVLGIGGAFLAMSKKDDMSSHPTPAADSTSQSSATPAAPDQVVIKDFAFGPKKITIKKGTKVTWTNQDDAKHDVAPDEKSEDFVASKLLAKGESYSFTFEKAGTYAYHCTPHPYMKATVEVTE